MSRITLCLILFLLVFLEVACNKKPDKVIDEKEFIDIMAEMQIAEAYINNNMHGPSRYEERIKIGKSILKEHGVSQEEIDSTLKWYGRNIDDYSALFEKIDNEIKNRHERLAKVTGVIEVSNEDSENLWPGTVHSLISDKGNSDGWILSLEDPDIKKGEQINWDLYILGNVSMRGNLGVEYTDGSLEMVNNTFSNGQHIKLSLITDTAKRVVRLFGNLTLKNGQDRPVYADSIKLIVHPYDSLEYKNRRNQKKYGALDMIPHLKYVKEEQKDSLLSLSDRVTS